ncbi:MAG: DNA alkylation repair protein [Clostridia bacterium]|nr:DNA alkylation repair protein [Clostridia bacterium]
MENITKLLLEMEDVPYADSSHKFFPLLERETILGAKSTPIKKLAKEFSKDDEKFKFLAELPHKYYEENNLHGLLLNSIDNDIIVVLDYVEKFLPFVNNWGTCDSTVASLKIFKKYPETVYARVLKWLDSSHTYTIRFGVVTLLSYFLDNNFDKSIFEKLTALKGGEYYVDMAIAWYFSVALVKQYDQTIGFIESKSLNKWVHNKSIQKSVESFRISHEKKAYLKSLKIK